MYHCKECWNESIKWQGQCSFCKAWNSLTEFKEAKISGWQNKNIWEEKELTKIQDIKEDENKIKTSSKELNNVLWWWIVKWWVVLLSWEPWIWKSTITLCLAQRVEKKIIYISWEETENQISSRANRIWIKNKNLNLLAENNIENIFKTLAKNDCDLLIIDSISVINSEAISWVAGSISQVRYITELLVSYAKKTNTAVFIIWHINKDWNLAWPKTLEHMVDTVLYFEWDKYDDLRILRALKNRFWATSEIWIFKMSDKWLNDLKNPWLEFVNSSEPTVGSSLSITIEWTRPIIIETESLTTYTKFWYPKRSSRWINSSKLDLIIAVLGKYTNIKLESHDVYSNIARWLKIEEPWVDLSLAASIISSRTNKKIDKSHIFVWEISLTWKIKNVVMIDKRIKEAEKLWFKKIFVPDSKVKDNNKIEIVKVKDVLDLVKHII